MIAFIQRRHSVCKKISPAQFLPVKLEDFKSMDIILIAGLPASGKSHFARSFFSKSDRIRVNRAEIRHMLFEMTHFDEPWHTDSFTESDEVLVKHLEGKIIQHYLDQRKKLLVDNSSITVRSRAAYIQTARRYRKTIGLIMIATPVEKCLERNRRKDRDNPVPETLISRLYSNLQIPQKSEGFDRMAVIRDY